MQQTKTQGGMARRRLMAFNLLTFLAISTIFGQTGQTVRTQIPYEFALGSKVLPAGAYTFSVTGFGLQIRSATGEVYYASILSRLGGPAEFLRDGSLVFDEAGGHRILSEVWIPGTDGILVHVTPKDHRHDLLMFPGTNQRLNVSGSVAFDRTCRKCHGPDGQGDERADKFFNIKIPRLNSTFVQSKSDAELRQIITQGNRAMDPVEVDESGFRHRLPAPVVDAVIAYVRTLKQ
jgi:hypothetical protein